jgi:AAHS family 4-hydroxybenzoate transporter-like MFS transporter
MTNLRRILSLILVAGVFVLDGYDINAMALAAPRLQQPLGLAPDQFGWVFSALLIGLGAGSALLGPLGDRFGRKPLIVFGCLAIAATTFGTASATTLTGFFVWRLLTGLALGAALPNCSALSAELAPASKRATVMVVVSAGISGGALVAGWFTPPLVALGGWQAMFLAPGLFAALVAASLFFALPKSAQPPASAGKASAPQLELLRTPWLFPFAVFAIALTMNSANLYLLSQWMPTILPKAGFTLDQAARVSGLSQGAGILAGLAMSWLVDHWRPGTTLVAAYSIVTLALLALAVGLVGGTAGWTVLLLVAMGGVSGGAMAFPALTAYLFPSRLLSSAIGLGVLVARVGAIVAPLIGGALLQAGAGPATFLFAAAIPGALCALVCVALPKALKVREAENPPRHGEVAAAAGG